MSNVSDALNRALEFVEATGVETYDPNDLKGDPRLMALHKRGAIGKLGIKFIYGVSFLFPIRIRKALGVRQQPMAGGIAQLATGYLLLGQDKKAEAHLDWLKANSSPTESGVGWGWPFAWQSGVATVPPNTPIGHTTMTVGNAFLRHYKATDDLESLQIAVKACEFLVNGLHRTKLESGGIAVSYTPLDKSQCVNSNADVASLLIRVGQAAGKDEFVDLGLEIATFAISAQNPDGSWNYLAGVKSGSGSIIDNYHMAMTLTAMQEIAWATLDDRAASAFAKGLPFYLDHLFAPDGRPHFATDRPWPVDIYSCAQGLITLSDAIADPHLSSELRTRCKKTRERLLHYTLSKMQDRDGSFIYRRYAVGPMRLKSLRWAQGLMIWALAQIQSEQKAG